MTSTDATARASRGGWWAGSLLMAIPVATGWLIGGRHWIFPALATIAMAVAWSFSYGIADHAPWRRAGAGQ